VNTAEEEAYNEGYDAGYEDGLDRLLAAGKRVLSAAQRLREAGHMDEFAERYIRAALQGCEAAVEGGEMGKGSK
jgi:hypothetical protein